MTRSRLKSSCPLIWQVPKSSSDCRYEVEFGPFSPPWALNDIPTLTGVTAVAVIARRDY